MVSEASVSEAVDVDAGVMFPAVDTDTVQSTVLPSTDCDREHVNVSELNEELVTLWLV